MEIPEKYDDLVTDAIEAATEKWLMDIPMKAGTFPWVVTATDDNGRARTVRVQKEGKTNWWPVEELGPLVRVTVEDARGEKVEVMRGGTG